MIVRMLPIIFGLNLVLVATANSQTENPKELFQQASKALKAGNLEKALEAYQKAEVASYSTEGKANAANGLGFTYLRMCKYDQAIQNFERVIEKNPEHKAALNNMGLCYLKKYETGLSGTPALDSAISAFQKVVELDPGTKSPTLQLAESYAKQEKAWAKAAQAREGQSRIVSPTGTYKSYKEVGSAAEAEGDFEFALTNYEKAEAAANGKRAKSAAGNFQGLVALKQRKPNAARDHFKRAIEINSKNKYAWNNLGAALMKVYYRGDGGREVVEEAVVVFKKVKEIDSEYFKPKNLELAESALQELGGPATSASSPESSTQEAEAPETKIE